MRTWTFAAAAAVLSVGATTPGWAGSPLPAPVWYQSSYQIAEPADLSEYDQNYPIHGPGVYSASGPGATVYVSAVMNPTPTFTINSTGTYNGGFGFGEIQMDYAIEVTGPASATPVPIFIADDASASSGVNDGSAAFVSVTFNGAGNYLLNLQSQNGVLTFPNSPPSSGETNGVYHFVNTEQVTLGSTYYLDIFVEAGARNTSADAFLDPYIYVDPTFPNADQYSVLLSPGIGNSVATPEPSTWMMAALGFGALGALGLRRRRSLVAAAHG
jgi:MYXO-CTERM domain-containing protein